MFRETPFTKAVLTRAATTDFNRCAVPASIEENFAGIALYIFQGREGEHGSTS
jgi:hypothetical protein